MSTLDDRPLAERDVVAAADAVLGTALLALMGSADRLEAGALVQLGHQPAPPAPVHRTSDADSARSLTWTAAGALRDVALVSAFILGVVVVAQQVLPAPERPTLTRHGAPVLEIHEPARPGR